MINFSRTFPWISCGRSKGTSRNREREPLREFVYLDEVSLASLLASQKGELTDNITAQSEEGLLTETSGKIGSNAPLLPSGEVASRFQTTNSSTLQTVRKATAQSLFRELHELEHLRRIQPIEAPKVAESISELFDGPSNSSVYKASDLRRGDLVEFRVKLSASWIFQMSTMVAEFSDMFDESPVLFVDHVRFSDLYQAKNANKIVNRLLAGLIPIDGLVPDYSVIDYHGDEFIVHNHTVSNLGLETQPLQIVGVTEHLAYWKDIRRILFANNEFTMLCRMSKPGIQRDWNPIKLADIFKDFAPDLANQIETSSRIAMVQSLEQSPEKSVDPNSMRLMTALGRYKELYFSKLNQRVTRSRKLKIDRLVSELNINGGTAEGQRAAFSLVRSVISDVCHEDVDSVADLEAREQVREELDLPLFPTASNERSTSAAQPPVPEAKTSRLLDVEVVAIYW